MIGSFMQGALLMGIIYWYSRGIMSMINDYYRSEFNRKIQLARSVNELRDSPLQEPKLDVDNLMDFVKRKHYPPERWRNNETPTTPVERHWPSRLCKNYSRLLHFATIIGVSIEEQCSRSFGIT